MSVEDLKYSYKNMIEFHSNISDPAHGMTDWIPCEFYLDPQGKIIQENGGVTTLDHRLIKVLVYKGGIKKVFCPHLFDGKCNREINELPGKRCYFKDE